MNARLPFRFAGPVLIAVLAAGCERGAASPPTISGHWSTKHIEWDQTGRPIKLTVEGRMHIGRLKLPTRPSSFDPVIQTMQNVTIQVIQTGANLRGSIAAGSSVPSSLLEQIGGMPSSVIAEFEGSMWSATQGSVVVTTADGQRREIDLVLEEGGRLVRALGVPVFGEAEDEAGDVVLIPID